MTAGAAGALLPGRNLARLAAQSRRRVTIGGRPIKVIDAHAHCVIPVTDIVQGSPLAKMGGGAGASLLGPQRLQVMDEQGVDVQALTINGFWWYAAADRDLADRIVRAQNEGLAKWVAQHPDRFVGMASVALQHPEQAAAQLEDGVKRLGLRGASIGGHVNGEDLSLPKYDPFWAKATELGVLVVMHPGGAENIIKDGALRGRGDLGNIIGNPLETTYFLSRLIFDGIFDKFPGLRVCAVHAGGYLPSYLGRSEAACVVRSNANCANKKKPSEYPEVADRRRYDGVLARGASPSRRRDGRESDRLRDRRALQLAGHRGPGAGSPVPERCRQGNDSERQPQTAPSHCRVAARRRRPGWTGEGSEYRRMRELAGVVARRGDE